MQNTAKGNGVRYIVFRSQFDDTWVPSENYSIKYIHEMYKTYEPVQNVVWNDG